MCVFASYFWSSHVSCHPPRPSSFATLLSPVMHPSPRSALSPVVQQVVVPVLLDADALPGDDARLDADLAEPALVPAAVPRRREGAPSRPVCNDTTRNASSTSASQNSHVDLCAHTHMHTHAHTHFLVNAHVCVPHTHTQTDTDRQTDRQTDTHTHTHTHTHTDWSKHTTHACMYETRNCRFALEPSNSHPSRSRSIQNLWSVESFCLGQIGTDFTRNGNTHRTSFTWNLCIF